MTERVIQGKGFKFTYDPALYKVEVKPLFDDLMIGLEKLQTTKS